MPPNRTRRERFAGRIAPYASQSVPDWPADPRPPQGAPNVVLILVDDLGFSDLGPFGAEIETPHVDALRDSGYLLSDYHTNPVCSPARASLLTGLDMHRAGFSNVGHADPGFPNTAMELPEDAPTVAESFQSAGYATFAVGKWHLAKESLLNDASPRSSWPLQRGFDRFFGCLDGFTSLHHPHRLTRDNSHLVRESYPRDYYLTDELTDEAEQMIRALRASDADKPFFLYFPHVAVHAPLQAKECDRDRYAGRYDEGWDVIRQRRFERQQALGVVAEGAIMPDLAADDPAYRPWHDLTVGEQRRYARYMEVYAAAVDSIDQSIGRLRRLLAELGELDNTVFAVTSDNGASGEGGPTGTRSYMGAFVDIDPVPSGWALDLDRELAGIGGPTSQVHYPRSWAAVSNTPFRGWKGGLMEGGVHAPLVISWPAGLPRGQGDLGIRHEFCHVTDLGMTLLDLAGVPHLDQRAGRWALPVDGRSLASVLRGDGVVREIQPWEYEGNRAVRKGAWKLVTRPSPGLPPLDRPWQLFDVENDPTETADMGAAEPAHVARLATLWHDWAETCDVYPMNDDQSIWHRRPSSHGRWEKPVRIASATPQLERYRSARLIALRSWVVEVEDFPRDGEGVLVAHGDQGGGYVLFVEDGEVRFSYNEYGRMHRISAPLGNDAAPARVRLVVDVLSDFRWRIALQVDRRDAAELPTVMQMVGLAPMTGISVGVDCGGPVDWELSERRGPFRFAPCPVAVRYVPGPTAPYDPAVVVELTERQALVFD